jgi:hypothetical protein
VKLWGGSWLESGSIRNCMIKEFMCALHATGPVHALDLNAPPTVHSRPR